MDRFVWFVLSIALSHLVTEFTRVSGYARGNRHEFITVNDSLVEPKSVHNMILYPGQQEYGLYESVPSNYYQGGNQINNYPYNNMNNPQGQQQNQQQNAQFVTPNGNAQQGFLFSFRPLIDSIFEIPISTLRAVNNLVARLTGSYQAPSTGYATQKSATFAVEMERSNMKAAPSQSPNTPTSRTSLLREEIE